MVASFLKKDLERKKHQAMLLELRENAIEGRTNVNPSYESESRGLSRSAIRLDGCKFRCRVWEREKGTLPIYLIQYYRFRLQNSDAFNLTLDKLLVSGNTFS